MNVSSREGREFEKTEHMSRGGFFRSMLAMASLPLLYFSILSCSSGRKNRVNASLEPKKGKKDVVIVGSGITGLVVGALLAKLNHRVRILEMHRESFGGHARSVQIGGLHFCLGPQYVWNFGPSDVGQRVLAFLGLHDDVPFAKMDQDCFERIVVGDDAPLDIPMGRPRFLEAMMGRFPDEEKELRRFFRYIDALYRSSRILHDKGLYRASVRAMRTGLFFSSGQGLRQKMISARLSRWTLKQLFDECGLSETARKFLYGYCGVFAEKESDLAAGIYASATGYYHEGAYFPRNGFPSLIAALIRVIEEHGGTVAGNKKVAQLSWRGRFITSVICSDGTASETDLVVSNLSPRLTCRLLSGCGEQEIRYQPSNSLVACCVGLRHYPELNELLKGRNYWWRDGKREIEFHEPDMTAPPAMLYVGSPTANGFDPAWQYQPDQGLILFAPGNYRQAKQAMEAGSEEYAGLKSKIRQALLSVLDDRLFPGIASRIRFAEVISPADIESEIGAENGSVYGRRLTVCQVLSGPEKPFPFDNLHIACAATGLPGIATGFQTAVLLCKQLTGVSI